MAKIIKENISVILIAGLAALLGFGMIINVFLPGKIRTEIESVSSTRANTYEVEEIRSKDDPDYDPVYNKTKTVNATKYHRTLVLEIDGKREEIDVASEFKFMLPGEGQKIIVSRDHNGELFWEHPIRDMLMGCAFAVGGSAVIVSTFKPAFAKKKSSKKNKKKK